MTISNWTVLLSMAVALIATQARAQQTDPSRPGGSISSAASHDQHQAADVDMMTSMAKMNHDMSTAPMTGDADRDFVAMMIPHHQGAIDMAEFELRHGKDPAIRRLATDIVAAQKQEIAVMRRWQAAHPKR
jgi:uncharacterized protein (DUF305 family)